MTFPFGLATLQIFNWENKIKKQNTFLTSFIPAMQSHYGYFDIEIRQQFFITKALFASFGNVIAFCVH
jgi:hypothetical protein